jgi:hypothetical protein
VSGSWGLLDAPPRGGEHVRVAAPIRPAGQPAGRPAGRPSIRHCAMAASFRVGGKEASRHPPRPAPARAGPGRARRSPPPPAFRARVTPNHSESLRVAPFPGRSGGPAAAAAAEAERLHLRDGEAADEAEATPRRRRGGAAESAGRAGPVR